MALPLSVEDTKALLAQTMPESVAELDAYVYAHLGYRIPSRAACPDHDAPLTFLAEAFFYDFPDILQAEGLRSVPKAVVLGSRKSGKTLVLAVLHLLNSIFKPPCRTAHVGATEIQGQRCYGYFTDFLTLPAFAHAYRSSLISMSRFHNGSALEILSGSVKSVSGPTPHKLSIDEFDQWDYNTFQTAIQMTVPSEQIAAQTWLVSTRYNARGLLTRLLPEAATQGYTTYRWCEWDTAQPCQTCDPACPLHTWTNPHSGQLEPLCRGRLLNAAGFRPKSDFLDKFVSSDPKVWAVQRNLDNPSAAGTIFDTFDPATHVVTPVPPGPDTYHSAGVDWGYADPAVILVGRWTPSGTLYIVDELYASRLSPDTFRTRALELTTKHGLIAMHADPSEPGSIEHWRAAGLPVRPAARRTIADGLSAIRLRLRDAQGVPTLFVAPNCTHLIEAMQSYHAGTAPDVPASRQDDHPIDALRYLVEAGPPPTFSGTTVHLDYADYRKADSGGPHVSR